MKKRIVFIIIMCLLLTGCSLIHKKKAENDDRLLVDFFIYNKINWKCEIPLSEIKEIQWSYHLNNFFITKDGKLYSFGEKYSNGEMCKRIETDIDFKNFYIYPTSDEISALVDSKNNFYGMDNNDIVDFYSLEYGGNKKYIKDLYNENPYGYLTEVFSNNRMSESFYYIKDNRVFKKMLDIDHNVVSDELFAEFPNGEKFISLNGKAFKTNKSYYVINSINFEDCNTYKDVKCESGLLKINYLSDRYDKVSYYNDYYIIINNSLYVYSGFDPDRFSN